MGFRHQLADAVLCASTLQALWRAFKPVGENPVVIAECNDQGTPVNRIVAAGVGAFSVACGGGGGIPRGQHAQCAVTAANLLDRLRRGGSHHQARCRCGSEHTVDQIACVLRRRIGNHALSRAVAEAFAKRVDGVGLHQDAGKRGGFHAALRRALTIGLIGQRDLVTHIQCSDDTPGKGR
jgi:hypothetical protein